MSTSTAARTPKTVIVRGLLKHCPWCGGGHLFRRWINMVDRCPRCGYRFEREEGFFLGAWAINWGVTMVVLAAFMAASIVLTLPDPPIVLLAVIAGVIMVATPILVYPYARTVWAAIHLVMDPLSDKERTQMRTASNPSPAAPASRRNRQ